MEEQPVTAIRETSRNLLKLSRRFHRDEDADNRRPVTNISVTPEIIEKIANKLKTSSSVTLAELQTLKNGLIEDPSYTGIILNVNGSMKGLVRELTGNNVRKQCAAAGCFCNLGLSDSKAGTAVVKAAGPYLVAALDSLSSELAVTCTWAVGNLSGSGVKASTFLAAQGAVTKLSDSLPSAEEELRDAALYALAHTAWQMKDELRTEHLTKILEDLSTLELNIASSQLLFTLSCHKDFNTVLPKTWIPVILTDFTVTINSHTNCLNCSKDCKLLNLVRTLANFNLDESIFAMFLSNFTPILDSFKKILASNDVLSDSVVWLLGNMFNFKPDCMFFNELLR